MAEKPKEKKQKKTILIFGVSSFVGSSLAEIFTKHYKVVGTYYNTRVNIPGVFTLKCNILVKDEVQLIIYALKPDITIYACGLSSIQKCSDSEELADALNTIGLLSVTEMSQRYKAQTVYLTSSFVFGGENKDYAETDIPDSNTVYGKTMAAGEFFLQKSCLNYLIFRCSRLYGRGINPLRRTFFEKLQFKMKKGRNFTCDNSIHTGYLDIYYLATIMRICFENNVQNRLFQVGTKDSITQYQFAKTYAEVFGDSGSLVSKGKVYLPEITLNNNLDDNYYYHIDFSNVESFLNITLPSVEESLQFTFERFRGEKGSEKNTEAVSFI